MLPKRWKDRSQLASVCKTFDMSEIPRHSGIFTILYICASSSSSSTYSHNTAIDKLLRFGSYKGEGGDAKRSMDH